MSVEALTATIAAASVASFIGGSIVTLWIKSDPAPKAPEHPQCRFTVGDRVLLDNFDIEPKEVIAVRWANYPGEWQVFTKLTNRCTWSSADSVARAPEEKVKHGS